LIYRGGGKMRVDIAYLEKEIPGFKAYYDILKNIEEINLSRRESEILVLLSKDFTVCKIAELLCREKTTVYKHIENARTKMNCTSLVSLGIKLSYFLK
jgi:DNA-binding NarL/FixJ family response regulator